MSQQQKAQRNIHQRLSSIGFTIVELLIVIVVIGILAAVTVATYTGIQNSANDAAIKSDLNNMAKQLGLFAATNGVFPTHSQYFNGTGGMTQVKISKSAYTTEVYNYYYCTDVGIYSKWGIAIRSKSGQTYTRSSTNGIATSASAPSWNVACGAFGETVLANVVFAYGYHRLNEQWLYGL